MNIAKEHGENCEHMIISLCQGMGIPIQSPQIERAHRLGNQKNTKYVSPILVRFLCFKDRQLVLQKKERFKQQGITVVEDLHREILQK